MLKKDTPVKSNLLRLVAALLFSGSLLPAVAQTTIYEQSRSGSSTSGANNLDFTLNNFNITNSANKSTAPGLPGGSTSSRFVVTPTNSTVSFSVSPNNTTAGQLVSGTTYAVAITYHNVATAGQQESSDIIVTTADTQTTGSDTFAGTTAAFRNGSGDTWVTVGDVTINGALPTFTFTWFSGTNVNRWSVDSLRFTPLGAGPTTQFWNTGSPGGTGAWNTSAHNWNTASDGSGTQGAYTQADLADFNGAAGTVSIDPINGITTDGGLEFDTTGYVIQSGPLTLGNGTNIFVVGALGVATINSVINGNNGLAVIGPGTLVLNNTNNLTGTVSVDAGVLSVGTNMTFTSIGGIPGGTLQLNTNTLTVGDANNTTFTATLADAGAGTPGNLIKQGAGTLLLNGTNTFHGTTTVNAGTVTIASDGATGTVPAATTTNEVILNNGGRLDFSTALTLNAKRGIFLGTGGGLLSTPGTSTTPAISGPITGPGSLTIPSGGLDLKSTGNTFSGGMYITATPVDSGGNSLCSVRFDAQGCSGTGKIFVSPTTSVNCTLRNFNTAGNIIVPNNLELDFYTPSQANTQIYLAGGASGTNVFAITFSGNINGAASVNIGLDTAGGSSNPGGTVNFSGSNSLWTGGATLQAGTLGVGSSNALGTGGLFLVPQGPAGALLATTPLTGTNALTNSIGINTSVTSLTLGGTNSLELAGPVFLYASSTLTVSNTGSTILSGGISDSTALSGDILTAAGPGTLTLSGASTYDGGTMVTTGNLKVNNTTGSGTGTGAVTVSSGGSLGGSGTISGTVDLSGILSPGATGPGKLTTADQTWEGGASYAWEINKAGGAAGTNPGWDQANITGGLNINASSGSPFTINIISLTSSNTPGPVSDFSSTHSYMWNIAHTATGITNFSSSAFVLNTANFTNSLGGGAFSITNNATDILLAFTSATPSGPKISNIHVSGASLTITGSGGTPSGTYRVLGSTNVAAALSTWPQVGTGSFDGSGNFTFNGSITPGNAKQFYVIVSP